MIRIKTLEQLLNPIHVFDTTHAVLRSRQTLFIFTIGVSHLLHQKDERESLFADGPS